MKKLHEVLYELANKNLFGIDLFWDNTKEKIKEGELKKEKLDKYIATQISINAFTNKYEIRVKELKDD